jgi:hypothetical protein
MSTSSSFLCQLMPGHWVARARFCASVKSGVGLAAPPGLFWLRGRWERLPATFRRLSFKRAENTDPGKESVSTIYHYGQQKQWRHVCTVLERAVADVPMLPADDSVTPPCEANVGLIEYNQRR